MSSALSDFSSPWQCLKLAAAPARSLEEGIVSTPLGILVSSLSSRDPILIFTHKQGSCGRSNEELLLWLTGPQ